MSPQFMQVVSRFFLILASIGVVTTILAYFAGPRGDLSWLCMSAFMVVMVSYYWSLISMESDGTRWISVECAKCGADGSMVASYASIPDPPEGWAGRWGACEFYCASCKGAVAAEDAAADAAGE